MAETWRGSGATVDRVVIRPPGPLRAFGIVFAVVWLSLPVTALVTSVAEGNVGPVVFLVPFITFGVVVISSNLRMRAVADENGLRIRNFITEHAFAPDEIERFVDHTLNGASARFGGGVGVLLRSGRLVDIRARRSGPLGNNRREAHIERLQQWLDTVSPHTRTERRQRPTPPQHSHRHVPYPAPPHGAQPASPSTPPAPVWPDGEPPSFS